MRGEPHEMALPNRIERIRALLAARMERIGPLEPKRGWPAVSRTWRRLAVWRPAASHQVADTAAAPAILRPAVWLGPPSEAPLVPHVTSGKAQATVLALVLELDGHDLDHVVANCAASIRRTGVCPVFVTDQDDFSPFRRQRCLFEHLARHDTVKAVVDEIDWELFRLRRLGLLIRKWRPMRVIPYGHPSATLLRDALACTELGGDVRAMLGVRHADAGLADMTEKSMTQRADRPPAL